MDVKQLKLGGQIDELLHLSGCAQRIDKHDIGAMLGELCTCNSVPCLPHRAKALGAITTETFETATMATMAMT